MSADSQTTEYAPESIWVIDQIEAGWVSLVAHAFDTDPITLPQSIVPQGLQEGDFVHLSLNPAPHIGEQASARIAAQIAELTQDDDGDDFSL